ncbi:pentatricopeptide repeat-containing protein At5g39710-like [Lotus japonicus]|uniref:pentatricopeptide repeat-containing protein At5g39710-like n=1 Tax=Lotus japonicus TaxID=34305 RepID=UPI002585AB2F|nr:pentatricopeptide repeat-containing protein At5g39710-like [Lotus japonicus]XP_057438862.1 pentatricopeptide repeat-containing protein At5g39710-like [Lotus japonicus]
MKLLLRLSFNGVLRRPSVNTYNVVMIRGFSGNSESESESKAYAARILWRCSQERVDEAHKVLSQMIDTGFSPSVDTYNHIIHGYCRDNRFHEALGILSQMIHTGVSPSVATYNHIIHGYCAHKRVHEALGILRTMPHTPDALTYNIIIHEFCKLHHLDKAFQIKAEMLNNGILPNLYTYETLIHALCPLQRLSQAFHLFCEMLRRGLLPRDRTYNTLINAYCLQGQFSKAFQIHHQLLLHNADFVSAFSPSLVTYNALIHGYCFLGRLQEALGILRGMPQMGLSPDGVSYNAVISALCRIRELGKAFDLKFEMDEKSIGPLDEDTNESLMEPLSDEDTYSSLMNEYFAQGNLEKAYALEFDMDHDRYMLPCVTMSVFLNGLNKKARTSEAKWILLRKIFDWCSRFPTYIIYDTLIENCSNDEFKSVVGLVKGFSKRGLVSKAARAHDTMLEGNYKPDGAVYNLLIFDHCRCLNVRKAYNMYMEMVHYGFVPHMFSALALIKALHYCGRQNEMSWVIQNTLRSCNLNEFELPKVLNEIDFPKCQINALLDVLAEIAMDGLLLDGGKCSYASART